MPERGNYHILVIDGDPRLGQTRCMLLQNSGYRTSYAANYAQARTLWAPQVFDLVLIDVEREPEVALEFCEELKAKDPRQLIALVAGHHVWVRPNPCPDDVIAPEHGPAYFFEAGEGTAGGPGGPCLARQRKVFARAPWLA
ncbi:MAG: hypothetical protein ACE14L_06430 [Terriglobales bacterium]